jgi:hypothetical protein
MRRVLLLILAALIVGGTFVAGDRLGMATKVTTRHKFYSIPYAISRLYFGARGYLILGDVADVFLDADKDVSNDMLRRAVSLHPRPDRLMLFPADDKGDADFVTASFLVFGLNIEGFYYMWFLMFVVPIGLFIAIYWRNESHLAALCLLLLAVDVGFSALPLTTELFSIQNPRSLGVVSLVSVLHLSFAMIDRQRLSLSRLAAAAVQAAFIAFSIHVRSTEVWQVVAVMGVAAGVLLKDRMRPEAFRLVWPAAVLIVAAFGLEGYQRASFAPAYATTHIQHRIFWHNVGIGFALNPTLAKKYALAIDDMPMLQLVRRRLVETNRSSEIYEVFRAPGPDEFNYKYYGIAKDYVRYEQIAREVVGSIIWNNKLEALKTFVIDKPRVLFRQLAWAAGYGGYTTNELYLSGQAASLVTDQNRRQHGIYLDVFKPWTWAGMIAAVLLSGRGHGREYMRLAFLALWICSVSLLPALVAYPIISALGVTLITVPFLMLSVFALLVYGSAAWLSGSQLAQTTLSTAASSVG